MWHPSQGKGKGEGEVCGDPITKSKQRPPAEDISSHTSALLRCLVTLQICLVSGGLISRLGNVVITLLQPQEGDQQPHAVGFPADPVWWHATCLPALPVHRKAHPRLLAQLWNGRRGIGHVAPQRQANYNQLLLRLTSIIQNRGTEWHKFMLYAC